MKWLVILVIGLCLLSLSFVSALDVPSQTRTTAGICEILTPDFTTLKQNTDFTFYFHVYNDSSFIDNTDANCTFHLYSVSDNGLHIFQKNGRVPFLSPRDFYAFVNGTTNLSKVGRYSYLFECGIPVDYLKGAQSDVCGIEGEFEVTPNGEELNISKTLFYLFLLIILILTFFLSFYKISSTENYGWVMGLVSLCYLLFISIAFTSYQLSIGFLTSIPFISTILYLLFFISLICFLPYFIILSIYLLGKVLEEREIKKMISMGYDKKEAKDMRKGR